MSTLYRSYRPQNFKEIVNQKHIKITLEHEIELGKIAHAYLFCGPRGIGKTTVARVFAKAVNCLNRKEGEHEPCNKCDICNEINIGRNMDIIEVDAASHTGVDNVRENIISAARVAPSRAKNKVFIIDEVHMLSISAFNALLKVLEEPPENVVFILCTTEVHKIPATIISRCQRFDFKRISAVDITKKLAFIAEQEKIDIDRKILEAIAHRSEGHMRDAESLLGQVVVIGGKKITEKEADLVIPRSNLEEAIKLIEALINNDAGTGIGIVNRLLEEGVDLKRFTGDTIELLRKIMLVKINPALSERLGLELGESIEIELNKISGVAELSRVIRIIEKFIAVKDELKSSFIIQLPLEIAIAELCQSPAMQTSRPINQTAPTPPRPSVAQNSAPISNPMKASSVQEPKAPYTKASPAASGQSRQIKREEILEKWNEVLIQVKKHNHSLTFILRVCEPREINDNKLCLAFKYKFHKDRISDVNIKSIVEKILLEVYKHPISIEAVVDERIIAESDAALPVENNNQPVEKTAPEAEEPVKKEDEKDSGKMVDNLMKAFGGKLIG